jgi:hypothetical protein
MSRTVAPPRRRSSAREEYEETIRTAPDNVVEAAARILELSRKPNLGPVVSRVLHAVADATTQLSQQAANHAASERTNMGVLLRIMEEVAALGLEAEDPLANARLRWIVHRRRLAHAEGRPLPTREVEALLGISRQAVAKARADGRLVGLPSGSGQYVYPSWQFGESGVLPGLREVRRALRDGDDPWSFTAFMVSPNARLDDETPLAVLRRGELNDVRRAAEAHGEHGAA